MGNSKRPESIQELESFIIKNVFGVFSGMDQEYKAIVLRYRKAVNDNKFSVEYLQQLRKEILQEVRNLMVTRRTLAEGKLAEIQSLYSLDSMKEVSDEAPTTEGQLLIELKRSNTMKMIDVKLEHSKDLKETYLELYREHKNDEYILTYMDVLSESIPETEKIMIERAVLEENKNPFEAVLNKVASSLSTLLSKTTTMYPSYLIDGIYSKDTFVFRDIAADLDLNTRINERWKNAYNTNQAEGSK